MIRLAAGVTAGASLSMMRVAAVKNLLTLPTSMRASLAGTCAGGV